jgi:NDP-sugar pyrophosphorylase family protein
MSNLTLLVLAAGMGSRYGGLKQIDPIGPEGETLMDYSIYDARRSGFDRVVFVIRKEIERPFKEVIGARYDRRIAVDYVFQEVGKLVPGAILQPGRTKPWGTTHAILMAANTIHEPFAVINADDFYGAQGYRALAHHLHAGSPDYAMVGYTLRNTLSDFGAVSRGVCHLDEYEFLRDIAELKSIERSDGHAINIDETGAIMQLTGDEIVSMNMWGFTPHIFDQLFVRFRKFLERSGSDLKAECYIPSTVNELIEAGEARVRVLRTVDEWFGVTYREDRPRAVEHIRRLVEGGNYPRRLWA